jgi:predicted Zn-dependent protease
MAEITPSPEEIARQAAEQAAAAAQAAAAQAQAALAAAEALAKEKIEKAKAAFEKLKALKEKLKNAKLKKPKFPPPPVFKPKELPKEEIAKFNQSEPLPPPPPPSKGEFIKEYTAKTNVKLDFYKETLGPMYNVAVYEAGTDTLVWRMPRSFSVPFEILIQEAESSFEYYDGSGTSPTAQT